jgi:hypothetical protein
MRLALLLAFLLGCGSKAKPEDTTTTSSSSDSSSTSTSSSGTVATTPLSTTTTTTASATTPLPPGSKPTPMGRKPYYSCFEYVAKNSAVKRHACMRSEDCAPYLEQAKSLSGIREITGCASMQTVYCFHQVGTQDDPEGLDVCQPTLDECKSARTDVVKAKMSVDTDCAQRS